MKPSVQLSSPTIPDGGLRAATVAFYFGCSPDRTHSAVKQSLLRMETFFRLLARDIEKVNKMRLRVGFVVTPGTGTRQSTDLWRASIATSDHLKSVALRSHDWFGGISADEVFSITCANAPTFVYELWFKDLCDRRCVMLLATRSFPVVRPTEIRSEASLDFFGEVDGDVLRVGDEASAYTDWLPALAKRSKITVDLSRLPSLPSGLAFSGRVQD